MSKLKVANFELQISKHRFQNGAYSFIGTMPVNLIVTKFIPFLSKHQDTSASIVFEGNQHSLCAGNCFYDKTGQIEVNFFTPEAKKTMLEDNEPLAITSSTVSYENLQMMVKLQDKVVRKLFKIIPELKESPEGTAYLNKFPNPGVWSRQVSDLAEWRKSDNGIDFMDDFSLDD